MHIPLCCGMERSGSTLTWQIVKSIVPKSRPLGWEPGCEVRGWEGHPTDWPVKRHDYFGGTRPVIYSYRHPLEAFLSLRRVFGSDAGSSVKSICENQTDADRVALEKILFQKEVYESYLMNRAEGRKVLLLRYEDYYENPELRIRHISEFLEIDPPLTDYEVSILCDYTQIDKNIERAGRLKSFNDDRDPNSGMQANHVDVSTRGVPGALMQKHASFVNAVNSGNNNLGPLKDMCELMGYRIPLTREISQLENNSPTNWGIIK